MPAGNGRAAGSERAVRRTRRLSAHGGLRGAYQWRGTRRHRPCAPGVPVARRTNTRGVRAPGRTGGMAHEYAQVRALGRTGGMAHEYARGSPPVRAPPIVTAR